MYMHIKTLALATALTAVGVVGSAKAAIISSNRDNGGTSGATEAGTFIFSDSPIIPSNSSADLADATNGKSFVQLAGTSNGGASKLAFLNNGSAQPDSDEPAASFYHNDNSTARVQVDLGADFSLSSINTYSWHTGVRAPQNYRVYGATVPSNSAPNYTAAPHFDDSALLTLGYTKIAEVNTLSLGSGGQHGVSITDSLGTYRYILFDLAPGSAPGSGAGTFFGEIDINGTAVPEPSTLALMSFSGMALLGFAGVGLRRRRLA